MEEASDLCAIGMVHVGKMRLIYQLTMGGIDFDNLKAAMITQHAIEIGYWSMLYHACSSPKKDFDETVDSFKKMISSSIEEMVIIHRSMASIGKK